MMIRYLLLLLVAVTGLAAPPNYTGMWKMDAGKSDFGPVPKPENFIRTIDHEDPKLHVISTFSSPQGDLTTDSKYTTDGKESVNQNRGAETRTTAEWDGNVLVLNSRRKTEGGEIVSQERWQLSDDGKSLDVTNRTQSQRGDIVMKIHMTKQ